MKYRLEYKILSGKNASLLRMHGENSCALVPNQIKEYKVTEIAPYCFAKKKQEGAYLVEDSGFLEKTAREINDDYIERAVLPQGVEKIGNFSFYNCRNLKELVIGTKLRDIGSDAFMNCSSLKRILLHARPDESSGLKQILSQISSDIEVVFMEGDNKVCAKIFYPEYIESYDEIAPAHIFGRSILGEGFRARQSFKEGRVDFSQYDLIFAKACVEERETTLLHIAANRLLYPVDLKDEAKSRYRDYVREHDTALMEELVRNRDLYTAARLCKEKYVTEKGIASAVTRAAERGWAEGAASFLKWKKEYTKEEKKSRYSFDAF